MQEMGSERERHYFLSLPPLVLDDSAGPGERQRSYREDSAQAAKTVARVPQVMGLMCL